MSNWPATLPQSPLIEGFSRRKRKNKREFTSQGGTTKSVLFYTAVPEILNLRFFLTKEQQETLEEFYDIGTTFGTETFTIPDPVRNETIVVKFIGDPPQYEPVGDIYWVATFELERQP